MQYRQGDVLFIDCPALPDGLKKREGAVVALGEATGHSHRFDDTSAVALYDAPDGLMYADVKTETKIVHEEHGPISFRPGVYQIRRQREYTPQAPRIVWD